MDRLRFRVMVMAGGGVQRGRLSVRKLCLVRRQFMSRNAIRVVLHL